MHAEAEGGASDEKQEDVAVGRLLRAPSFFLLLISAMLGAAIITILDPTLGPHLEDILDYGPGTIGVAFAVIAAVYAAFTPFAGYAAWAVCMCGVRLGCSLCSCWLAFTVVAAVYTAFTPFAG